MIKFPTTKRVDLYKTAVSSEQLHLDLVAAQEFMFCGEVIVSAW